MESETPPHCTTYLNLVDITDGVVEFNRPSLLWNQLTLLAISHYVWILLSWKWGTPRRSAWPQTSTASRCRDRILKRAHSTLLLLMHYLLLLLPADCFHR